MYPFIVNVAYWDDLQEPWTLRETNILLYADDMTDAVTKVERNRYFENIETIKIIGAGEEDMLFEVPGHIAEILRAGGADYNFGLNATKDKFLSNYLRADANTTYNATHLAKEE